MAWLFISHSRKDDRIAERIRRLLESEGYGAVFLDFDPEKGIVAGRDWEHELWSELRKVDAVVFLDSADSRASRWCFAELALARSLALPIIPLAVGGDGRHDLLADLQAIDLSEDVDRVRERVRRALRSVGDDPSAEWDRRRAPFPGLRAFGPEDAAVFFGREKETAELERRLHPTLERGARRMIALVGRSGSGKSSLVRSGLIPRLRANGDWVVLPPMRPEDRPVRNLARVLSLALGSSRDRSQIERRLDGEPRALIDLAEEVCDEVGGDARRVLLVIDQAEELATLVGAADRGRFVDLLRGGLVDDSPLWVIATVRSEFLDTVLTRDGLVDAFNEPYLLWPLDRSRLFEVIERPAKRAGLKIDAALVAQMVDDTVAGDALPLLAHTLRRLWERAVAGREGPRITREDYEEIGGVIGSLQDQADQISDELARRGLGELVIPTLLQFATVEGHGDPTRRRLAQDVLPVAEREVIQAFVDQRLLIASQDEGKSAVVEVAHEALLRHWPPLREALTEASGDLRTRSDLERLAADWLQSGQRDSYLLRGDRLDEAVSWASSHEQDLAGSPIVREFLADSQQAVKRAGMPPRDHYESVLENLSEGAVAIVLGFGVNAARRAQHWQPGSDLPATSNQLAAELSRRFLQDSDRSGALADVARRVSLTHGDVMLEHFLSTIFGAAVEPSAVHKLLARLPRAVANRIGGWQHPLIVTTTFDRALEGAFDLQLEEYDLVLYADVIGEDRKFVHVPYGAAPVAIDAPAEYSGLPVDESGRLFRTVIVKPFGSVITKGIDRETFVVTSDDLDNYMSERPIEELFPRQLLRALSDSHCLFAGLSARDLSVRVLLRRIWGGEPLAARSWAIDPEPEASDRQFWSSHGVALYATDIMTYFESLADVLAHADPPQSARVGRPTGRRPGGKGNARTIRPPGGANAEDVPDSWYEMLARTISGRTGVVSILGLGVNRAGRTLAWSADSPLFPDGDELASELAVRFGTDHGTIADVAQEALSTYGGADLCRALRRVLVRDVSEGGPVDAFLARLPTQLSNPTGSRSYQMIVDCRFDTGLEETLRVAGEPYDMVIYMARGAAKGRFLHLPWDAAPREIDEPNAYYGLPMTDDLELRRTVIVKPFGRVDGSVDNYVFKDNYVITADDLDAYLKGRPAEGLVPVQLLAKLRDSALLFMGHRGSDLSTRVLINRFWRGRLWRKRSWAVAGTADETERSFWRAVGVELTTGELGLFVERLEREIAMWEGGI